MINRHILPEIKRSLKMFPCVLLIGGRQIGKSTILKQLYDEQLINDIYSLDSLSVLESLANDCEGFLQRTPFPVAFDEIQRYPKMMLAIKKIIDEQKRPGMFVLTGSANILSYPHFQESLAGRCDIITVEGLSTSEALKRPAKHLIKQLFDAKTISDFKPDFFGDMNLIDTGIFYGSYPEVRLNEDEYFRSKWFNTYEMAYIERDVRDFAKSIDIIGFGKVFKLLALQAGGLLNYHHLSVESGIDHRMIKRYIEILTITFQMTLLQPYYASARTRLVKSPKVYMNDVGHACYQQGIQTMDQESNGHLLETWLFSELRKAMTLETNVEIYFYRTTKGKEVDFILKRGTTLRAIECKSKIPITTKDISGLHDFLSEHKEALGFVFYKGNQLLPMADRILAVPMTYLF
jgi:predicted AAA+ superfamily ATPase